MPIYEYQCQACEHKMEALQKMADAPLTHCPACQQESLKKLISAAAFKLTGSGWYETDFKNNNKPPVKNGESNSSAAGEKSSKSTNNTTAPGKSGGGVDKAAS